MEIFKLFGSIFVDNEKANKSISETDSKAGGLAGKLKTGIATAAKWGASITGAAVAGGAALFGMANKATDTLDRVDKLSQKIGMSRQGFQEWDYILSQSGTDVEKLQMGFKTLVTQIDQADKGMGKGARNFEALGISVRKTNGELKTQEEVFNEVAVALQNMPNGAEKARIANELLGRSGSELMPLLQGEAGSIEELRENAHRLGIVLSDEAVDAGVLFQDTMDDLKRSFGAIATNVGAAVIPIFQQMAEWIIEHMPQIQKIFQTVFKVIEVLVVGFIDGIKLIIRWVKQWVGDNEEQVSKIREGFVKFFEAVKGLIEAFVGFAVAFWEKYGDSIISVAKFIWDIVTTVFSTAFNLITDLFNIFAALFRGDWEGLWEGVKDFFGHIWDGIYGILKGTINLIIRAINGMVKQLNKVSFNVPDWIPFIGGKKWGFNLPTIPELAEGGRVLKSGLALVGEAGPEMLHLPKGAKVAPLEKTVEKDINLNINFTGLPTDIDESMLKQFLLRIIREPEVGRTLDEIGHRNQLTTLRPQGMGVF